MKIVCSKENLSNGINIVQKAVSQKSTLPILEGILFEAEDTLKLTGNDLEVTIECTVAADIINQGSIVINSKMMGDIVRKLPEAEVSIEVLEDNKIVIECENCHFDLIGTPSKGFPKIPIVEEEISINLSQESFRTMIKQTIFAVSTDENRATLTGSLIESSEGELIVVSIDGFRMALRKSKVENPGSLFKVIVPGKTMSEVSKILGSTTANLKITGTKNQIMFDLGNCKMVSRLLDGEYLNHRSIIPKEYETVIEVSTKELMQSIERASVITTEEKKYPIKFKISDDLMIITSNTEISAVREEVRVKMSGHVLEIAFNPRYFIDALRAIEEDCVKVFFNSNVGPCTIKPVDKDNFVYMILPVRTRSDG